MDLETQKAPKPVPEDQSPQPEPLLKRKFLILLETIAQFKSEEVEPNLNHFPSQLSNLLFPLMVDSDSGVRAAVHVVIYHFLKQSVPVYQGNKLTTEQQTFLISTFGTRFHQLLCQLAGLSNVSPVDFLSIHKTLTALLEAFDAAALPYSIPLIFKIQDDAAGFENAKQRGTHNLVLAYLIFVAEYFKCKELLTYLTNLKNERVERNQWLPSLDFQPEELKLMRGKSISALDKKKKNKPDTQNTSVPKSKFIDMLLSGSPGLKEYASQIKQEFVPSISDFDKIPEEDDESADANIDADLRRFSSPLQSEGLQEIDVLPPTVFKALIKDPFKHSFDHMAFVDLDSRESVLEFLNACLPNQTGAFDAGKALAHTQNTLNLPFMQAI